MSIEHEIAVPQLHARLFNVRQQAEHWRELAHQLAVALDAEVDLRLGSRGDDRVVRSQTSYVLNLARREGLL